MAVDVISFYLFIIIFFFFYFCMVLFLRHGIFYIDTMLQFRQIYCFVMTTSIGIWNPGKGYKKSNSSIVAAQCNLCYNFHFLYKVFSFTNLNMTPSHMCTCEVNKTFKHSPEAYIMNPNICIYSCS